MNETVVIYKSRYGSTKKYAQWISESLNADIFESNKIRSNELDKYKTIIYGGGLYASGITGFSLIRKNFNKLKDKNLILFTVGLANPINKEQFAPILEKNLSEEMKSKIKVFHFRGAIHYKKLSFIHKSMMAMLKKSVERIAEDKRDAETKMMLETYGQVVDFTDKTSIKPLIEYCNHL
ncbi:flavodoxin [Clostridium perfringens]|nr:flavodoxin [Clostridium perfringens]